MEINKIELKNKYFKIDFKHNILGLIIINAVGLLVFFSILFYIFIRFYSAFENEYKLTYTADLNREITHINNSMTNIIAKKSRMNKAIKYYLKNKYISSIWISDSHGFLILHSSEKIKTQQPDLKKTEYRSVFWHNWSFQPDGSVIPLIKDELIYDFSEIFYPIYNINNNKIDFITGIKFHKHLSKIIFIPKLNIYVNIFYVIIVCFGLLLTAFIVFIIAVISSMKYDKHYRKSEELLKKLYEIGVDNLPFQFDFKKDKFNKNFIANFINYINHLSGQLSQALDAEKTRQDKIKQVLPPAIFDDEEKDQVKIVVKPDKIDLKQFLWEFYHKDSKIKTITDYSTGLYHYYKEKNSNIVFKYFDISDNKKGFFIGKVVDTDINAQIFLLSMLNFLLIHYKEDISYADKYLTNINNLINQIGRSQLTIHACYMVLNLQTDYIEISSTNFSPVIHYKFETGESSFYEFNSMPCGKKYSDEFLKELNKESFKLFPGDVILLPDDNIEKLINLDRKKLEIYKITDVLNKYKSATAELLVDKIKNEFHKFSVDFSKLNDLFILIIKKNENK